MIRMHAWGWSYRCAERLTVFHPVHHSVTAACVRGVTGCQPHGDTMIESLRLGRPSAARQVNSTHYHGGNFLFYCRRRESKEVETFTSVAETSVLHGSYGKYINPPGVKSCLPSTTRIPPHTIVRHLTQPFPDHAQHSTIVQKFPPGKTPGEYGTSRGITHVL